MKSLQKEITGTQTSVPTNFGGKLSFIMSASTIATYIFTDPTCAIIIIILEPCALNVEFDHFIPRFNKNYFADTTEKGDRGLKQRR